MATAGTRNAVLTPLTLLNYVPAVEKFLSQMIAAQIYNPAGLFPSLVYERFAITQLRRVEHVFTKEIDFLR
jgi:hypothetical protein